MEIEKLRMHLRFTLTWLFGAQILLSFVFLILQGFGVSPLFTVWTGIPVFFWLMQDHRKAFDVESSGALFLMAAGLYVVLPVVWPLLLLTFALTYVYEF